MKNNETREMSKIEQRENEARKWVKDRTKNLEKKKELKRKNRE